VVGAAHELIRNGFGGRIFRSGDCGALRQALLEVTAADQIDQIKRQAHEALTTYRYEVDPVAEIRRALCDVGVLKNKTVPVPERILKDCSSNA
jgi:hypothetical protein